MTKQDYRDRMQARRQEQSHRDSRAASEAAQDHVLQLPEFSQAHKVCCYLAMSGELDTGKIQEACWRAGKELFVLARCQAAGEYRPVTFARNDKLEMGKFGVPEPVEKQWCEMATIDLIVVPGLAFDPSGGRVGWGFGYYDRLLITDDEASPAVTVGLAFDFQVVERVPTADHDVPLDVVITEKRTLRCDATAGP